MAREFTPQQKEALRLDVHNVLVSAGAGSGKTAVLTQRIFNIIESGVGLDEILVLTFTNKAAFEMKERTKELLSKDPNLAHLANDVDSSNITTFDAYALSIVKKYGYLLGLSSNIEIIPESVFDIKIEKIIDNVFKRYHEFGDETFKELVYNYCVNKDENLKRFVLEICKKSNLVLNKDEFFSTYEEKYMDDNFALKARDKLFESISMSIDIARDYYLALNDTKYADIFEEYFYNPRMSGNYDILYDSLFNKDFKFPQNRTKDEYDKEVLGFVLSILKEDVYNPMRAIGNTEDILKSEHQMKKYNLLLLKIAKEVNDELYKFKEKHDGYSFSDIASLAYKIVNIPEVNNEIKYNTKFIMIDEYQDTSDLQEGFVNSIANDNVFMVGDVKQSIYRFRNSNPEIFVKKYQDYQNNKGGKLITFPDNFRSREGVISSINEIFEDIMSEECGGVNYSDNHQLKFGNKYFYEELGHVDYDQSVSINTYEPNKELTNSEVEIRLVLDDIKRKLNDKYQVFDKDLNVLRDCRKGDFAILVQKRSHYQEYIKAFNEAGIALKTDEGNDARLLPVILVLRSILGFIISIRDDEDDIALKHNFCSIARSFLCQMKDEELFEIILKNKIKDSAIYEVSKQTLHLIKHQSIYQAIITIIKQFGFVDSLVTIGDVEANQAILNQVVNLGQVMDKLEYTFDDFYEFLTDLDEYEVKFEVDSQEDIENSVNILTMHKSKGLEYPIVYLIELAGKSQSDSNVISGSVVSIKYGIHLKDIFNEKTSIFQYLGNKENKDEQLSEKMRLLYVALTRAKEKAIAIMPNKVFEDMDKNFESSQATTMASFFKAYKKVNPRPIFIDNVPYEEKENKEILAKKYQIHEVSTDAEEIIPKRASKQLSINSNKDVLRLGTRLHELMQIVDMKSKDTSFIKDKREKSLIDNVLNSKLFANASEAIILHEYDFIDEINQTTGVIDLLMVFGDHVDIIDFKLKNIDDDEYDVQLGVYENYIRSIIDKPIKKYLLSILDGSIREVE